VNISTKTIAIAGVFAALIFTATFLLGFPLPIMTGGYVNLGDVFIYLAGFLFGGPIGAVAAAIGSALADLIKGFAIYAPATFVIKGVMAFVVGHFASGKSFGKFAISVAAAALFMVAAYFVFELALFSMQNGKPVLAIANIPFNLVQAAGCFAIAMVLYKPIDKFKNRLH
jgi:uncharacterized membrane protein